MNGVRITPIRLALFDTIHNHTEKIRYDRYLGDFMNNIISGGRYNNYRTIQDNLPLITFLLKQLG